MVSHKVCLRPTSDPQKLWRVFKFHETNFSSYKDPCFAKSRFMKSSVPHSLLILAIGVKKLRFFSVHRSQRTHM